MLQIVADLHELVNSGVELLLGVQRGCTASPGSQLPLPPLHLVPMQAVS